MSEQLPVPQQEENKPCPVIEIEAVPGVYEVYDKETGELVDIGGGQE